MRLRSLRAAWKRAPWMRHLSGLTSPPSMLGHGVEQWIASLRDSPASLTATPEAAREPTTSDGYGPRSQELFATLERGSWFSKTCQDSFLPVDSTPYSQTWPKWGSMRNGECFLREAWAPVIGASECSSWPTARAEDSESCGNHPNATDSLTGATRQWPTPDANTSTYSNAHNGFQNIREATALWTTPQAHDVTHRGSGQKPTAAAGNACLARDTTQWQTPVAGQASVWPTPTALPIERSDSTIAKSAAYRKGKANQNTVPLYLGDLATRWPTPCAQDDNKSPEAHMAMKARMKGGARNTITSLQVLTQTWPTPASRDAKGENSIEHVTEIGGGQKAHGSASELRLPFFAPGPSDERWPGILAEWPHLAPAVEPGVRLLADGATACVDEHRAHQLRCGGNGVVPLQAACAIVTLFGRLGIEE